MSLDILIIGAASLLLILGLRSSRNTADVRIFTLAVVFIIIRTSVSVAAELLELQGRPLIFARVYLMTFCTGCATGAFFALVFTGGLRRLIRRQLQ